jgi:hypothetical protein
MKQLLVFILLSGILCWLMFAPFYRHVAVVRHALLQQEVDYLLEIGANAEHGYISAAMIEQSRRRLAERGFDPESLAYEVSATTGGSAMNPASPVPRGEGIVLKITYPFGRLFVLDRLIGVTGPGPGERMSASGMRMSEYVPW